MKDTGVTSLGSYLGGKRVALCVTGGIAAIETPKIARQFRRYDAQVKAYTTQEALKFIGKAALEWATDNDVVTELSGRAEHICLEDIVVVAPATTNTINKIFAGIADNPVTALIASALGQKKDVYLVPTMHESLYANPFLKENLARAGQYGIKVIEPRVSEGKLKIPKSTAIVKYIIEDQSFLREEDRNG